MPLNPRIAVAVAYAVARRKRQLPQPTATLCGDAAMMIIAEGSSTEGEARQQRLLLLASQIASAVSSDCTVIVDTMVGIMLEANETASLLQDAAGSAAVQSALGSLSASVLIGSASANQVLRRVLKGWTAAESQQPTPYVLALANEVFACIGKFTTTSLIDSQLSRADVIDQSENCVLLFDTLEECVGFNGNGFTTTTAWDLHAKDSFANKVGSLISSLMAHEVQKTHSFIFRRVFLIWSFLHTQSNQTFTALANRT
jgi:hypothetical protein